MKLVLEIETSDIEKVHSLLKAQSEHKFVKNRIQKNINTKSVLVSKKAFWKSLVMCLLTTQQRSGEDSSVTKFLNLNPNPLEFETCCSQNDLRKYVFAVLTDAKSIRRTNNIGIELETNFIYLERTNWEIISKINSLINIDDRFLERKVATEIQENLKGIGPKQARNLLQDLGLTKYETPIDSRIIKWLKDFNFPIPLSSMALQDKEYYNYVSDILFKLSESADVKPCVLDAAIFSMFEKNR